MATPRTWRGRLRAALLSVNLLLLALVPLRLPEAFAADAPPVAKSAAETESRAEAVFTKAAPETLADLRAIQERVQSLVKPLTRCTVGVRVGKAQGSGVIVGKEGYVLTAAHVCGSPGRRATLTLWDGREVPAQTLGLYRTVDAGLMKIEGEPEEGEQWPFAEMGDSETLKAGSWCIAVGHPGGYQEDRGAVLRLGRVLLVRDHVVQSDCPLVGGDSGGPLFDMDGRVIGINSRIGSSTSWNFHVPVSHYTENWERLTASEEWGGTPSERQAVLGINGEDHPRGCRVTNVAEGLPADEAGLKPDDIITKLDGIPVKGILDLADRVGRRKPGDRVSLTILRGEETIEKTAELAEP